MGLGGRGVGDPDGVGLVGVDLTGLDGLAGVGWPCPCVWSRVGLGGGPVGVPDRDAAVEAVCGMGDGSSPGVAGRAGCLPCGLAGALTGGSVPAQVMRPQSAFELGE